MSFVPAIIGGLGTPELIIVLMLGLLLFGERLPEVGRSLGRSMMEFKRGLRGIQDEFDSAESEARHLLEEEERREALKQPAATAEAIEAVAPAATPSPAATHDSPAADPHAGDPASSQRSE